MAKLSLSNVLYNRRRMNYLTLLCCLILVFFLGSILIAKNPNKTRAAAGANIYGGNRIVISPGCTKYELYNYGGVQEIKTTGCPLTSVTNIPVDTNLELDGWGGALTVITYSGVGTPVKLNSLRIVNSAKLTHDALTVAESDDCDAITPKDSSILGSDDLSIVTPECNMARAKKVEIEATTSITLSVGGNIDVYGKGYPGGEMTVGGGNTRCVSDAYGPGRGGNCLGNNYPPLHADVEYMSGAGGSFGGHGNVWVALPAANVGTTYNYIASSGEVEFGSGGQAIADDENDGNFSGGVGGAGGGRVKLTADLLSIAPTSYISADGGFGSTGGDTDINITSGGGSGGAIVIDVNNIDMISVKNDTSPAVTDRVPDKFLTTAAGGKNIGWPNESSDHYGSDGVVRVINTSADLYQLSAQGGRACGYNGSQFCSTAKDNQANNWTKINGSGGGGGWIVVQSAGDVSGVSINKSLSPVSRTDGSGAVFNPYALKMGDIITVNLEVYNMTPGNTYTITDQALTTSGLANGQKCGIVANSAVPNSGPMADDVLIAWSVVSDATGHKSLSYRCQVQSMAVNLEG